MDLINKRSYLSKLLMELLHQQDERRAQLFATLKLMEERNSNQDFWLLQYQQLLERSIYFRNWSIYIFNQLC